MKRIRGTESPMSFFSFQDIIACVTGIMILVTLMLAINPLGTTIQSVTRPGHAKAPQVPDEGTTARVEEARERLTAAQEAVQRLTTEIEERRTRPEISAQQVESAEKQAEAEEQSLRNLEARVGGAESLLALAANAETAAALELKRLEQREVEARRAQAKARMRLRLLEGAPEGFEPVIVEITPIGISIGELDEEGVPGLTEQVAAAKATGALRAALSGRDLNATLVLFIVQPGGIEVFEELRAMITGAVAMGWQLWDPSGGSFFYAPEKLVVPPAAELGESTAP